jgi:hypothetical protein
MVTHNGQYAALLALDLDQLGEVLRLYDQQVWGVAKDDSHDQINAVSLLARLQLAGVDVGGRRLDLAVYLAPRVADHVLAFLDLQYLNGLARAGRAEADVLYASMRRHAERDPAWRAVALPAAAGGLAHARGDYALAVT